jgi:hypothetical protein
VKKTRNADQIFEAFFHFGVWGIGAILTLWGLSWLLLFEVLAPPPRAASTQDIGTGFAVAFFVVLDSLTAFIIALVAGARRGRWRKWNELGWARRTLITILSLIALGLMLLPFVLFINFYISFSRHRN